MNMTAYVDPNCDRDNSFLLHKLKSAGVDPSLISEVESALNGRPTTGRPGLSVLFGQSSPAPSKTPSTDPILSSFETFWQSYPKRSGFNSKKQALKSYKKAIKNTSPADLLTAVKSFAVAEKAKIGTEFIPMASTWLNQSRWEAYLPDPSASPPGPQKRIHGLPAGSGVYVEAGTPEWDAWRRYRRDIGLLPINCHGWQFPTRWPPSPAHIAVPSQSNGARA